MLWVILFGFLAVIAVGSVRVSVVWKALLWSTAVGIVLWIVLAASLAFAQGADDCRRYRTAIAQDICERQKALQREFAARARSRALEAAEARAEAERRAQESETGTDAVHAIAAGIGRVPDTGVTSVRADGPSNPELDELRRQAGIR